jgi:FkbM family methyltransferase
VGDHWLLANELIDSSTVIDLGANRGIFSREIRKRCACRIVAIEPNPTLCAELRKDGFESHSYAIAPADGPISFFISENSEASSILPNFENMWGTHATTVVEGLTYASLRTRLAIEAQPVGALKVDIEGGELPLIETLKPEDIAGVSQITVEFHDWLKADLHGRTKDAIRKLVSMGFRSYTDTPNHKVAVEMLFLNKRLIRLGLRQRVCLWIFSHFAYLNYN